MRQNLKNMLFKWALICVFLFHFMQQAFCAIDATATYPAWCTTTTNLNIRTSSSASALKIATVPKKTSLKVIGVEENGWAKIDYQGRTAYCSGRYLSYVEHIEETTTSDNSLAPIMSAVSKSSIWLWVLWIAVILIGLAILRKILLFILGWLSYLFYKLYLIISFPFYVLNMLQRHLAKPWLTFYKKNKGTEAEKEKKRRMFEIYKIPLYIILTPLRFVNAVYYNLLVHCCFEVFNYIVEVIVPANKYEGESNFILWVVMIPWRIAKYVVWHGALTILESSIWTVIDTFVPTLTLYHGTDCEAAESITQGPGRVCSKNWLSGVWNVGGGNYAGNGIYFAPVRSTAFHYAAGSLIVCRVSLGRTLDLGLAPKHIYDLCGHPNALGVTKWGLNNGYVTGEWWRDDAGWWEYCMYDWQNRYNHSWRIRPLYVLNLEDECIQRIPGGMYHWLFRKMAVEDLFDHLSQKFPF